MPQVPRRPCPCTLRAPGSHGRGRALLALLGALAGCEGVKLDLGEAREPDSALEQDSADSAGADTSPDSAADTGADTSTDTDSATDTSSDTSSETSSDTSTDTGEATDGVSFADETSVSDALVRIASDEPSTDLGRVLRIGDLDGDGQPDAVAATYLAEGQTGGAFVVPGPLSASGDAQDLGYRITGVARSGGTGRSMSVGDLDGDGYTDLGLGAPYSAPGNGLYLAFGPITEPVTMGEAGTAALIGPYSTYAGHGSDLAGDVDGDGLSDAVVGAYYTSSRRGQAFVVYGPVGDDLELEHDADAWLVGESGAVYAGRIVDTGGDVDGDGVGDLVIACLGTMGLPASGGYYVVYGPPMDGLDMADADGRYEGPTPNGYAGLWLATGDLNGDGLDDIAASALDSTLASSAGAAYLVEGPASADTNLSDAEIIVRGDELGQYGGGVALGDLDADGDAELLLGAQGDSSAGPSGGAAYLFVDPEPGSYVFSDADAGFIAEGPGDNLGAGGGIGDLDHDGVREVLISAPYQDDGASGAGAFYVMHML